MNKPTTVNEDAQLGPEWQPIETAPIIPGSSHGGTFPQPTPLGSYITAAISPSLQHDADFVKTAISSPGIPKYPLMPVAPSGIPSTNAGVQSTTAAATSQFVSSGASGPNGAIQINEGGVLYGDSGFTYDKASQSVQIGGALNIGGALVISGGLTITGDVAVTGNAAVSGFINSGSGYQIGGAAASGHYLRGNGTDFISAVLSGSDLLTGLVGVTYGGTGANLSATGGASQVLKQTSVGGSITVAQLSASDLSNGVTGTGLIVLSKSPTLSVVGSPAATALTILSDPSQSAPIGIFNSSNSSYAPIAAFTFSGKGLGAGLFSTPILMELNTPSQTDGAVLLLSNQTAGSSSSTGTIFFQHDDGSFGVVNQDAAGNDGALTFGGGIAALNALNLSSAVILSLDSTVGVSGALYPDVPSDLGTSSSPFGSLILSVATPTVSSGQLGIGITTGFGNGLSTPITTLALGTGSGPATPGTVAGYLKMNLSGTDIWLPYMV